MRTPFLSASASPINLYRDVAGHYATPPTAVRARSDDPVVIGRAPKDARPSATPSTSATAAATTRDDSITEPTVTAARVVHSAQDAGNEGDSATTEDAVGTGVTTTACYRVSPSATAPGTQRAVSREFTVVKYPSYTSSNGVALPGV